MASLSRRIFIRP